MKIDEIRARCEVAIELANEIREGKLSYSGQLIIQRSLEDNSVLLSEHDRLTTELEKSWKQVHEEIALEIEQVKRIELLEAELSEYREGMKGTYGIL